MPTLGSAQLPDQLRQLSDELPRAGITVRIIDLHSVFPLDTSTLQEAARDWGYGPGDFPHAEALAREVLCLPIHPFLADSAVDRVIEAVLESAARSA